MANSVDSAAQVRLAAVLRYRGYGDFAAFCHAANLALGSATSEKPFYCADLLFSYQLAGLCEVSYATGVVEWWSAHTGDIGVQGAWIKSIGVSPDWFRTNESQVVPLISDVSGKPLVLGAAAPAGPGEHQESIFGGPVNQIIPAFKDVEQQLCVEVPYEEDLRGDAERFHPDVHQWRALDSRDDESRLIRVKRQYSGIAYFVEHPRLGLRFRLPQPEWAYVVAFHLLPWRLDALLEIVDSEVRMHRSIRLPIVMYRALFAASLGVEVGPIVRFTQVSEGCAQGFLKYFSVAEGRL